MSTNPKTQEEQEDLNKRLRSLKIDRAPEAPRSPRIRPPKLLLLALSVLIVLAAMGYSSPGSASKRATRYSKARYLCGWKTMIFALNQIKRAPIWQRPRRVWINYGAVRGHRKK